VSSEPAAGPCVFAVVPAFDEAARIGDPLRGLEGRGLQVVVVDDGSRDETARIALQRGAWLLRNVVNCGQGAALQTGIDFALGRGAEVIVTFDADGQHDPEQISRLVEPLLRGEADVALGSRFLGSAVGMPRSRRLLLRAAVLFSRALSRLPVTDAHNGFRALSRRAAQRIRLQQPRMAHASELLDQIRLHRLRFVEVPVTIRYTPAGLAKGQSNLAALRILGELLLGRLIP